MIGSAKVSVRPACVLGLVCAAALAAPLAFASPAGAECPNETLRGIRFSYFLLDASHPLHIELGLLDLDDQFNKKARPSQG